MRNILKNLSALTLGSLAFGAVLAADFRSVPEDFIWE